MYFYMYKIETEWYGRDMATAEKLATTTELARDYGRILDDAAKGPVSIPRGKKPDITLIGRDRWQQAEASQQWMMAFSVIVRYGVDRIGGDSGVVLPAEFEWLRAFEPGDLLEFLREFSNAMKDATMGVRPWEEVEDVLYEWHRSAIVLLDKHLTSRLKKARANVR